MRRRVAAVVCTLLMAAPWRLHAQDVSATASVDSTDYLIGDWITVHIDVRHPRGATLTTLVGDTLAEFQVVDRGTLEKRSDTETATRVVVAGYDSSLTRIPPIPFLYTLPGDSTGKRVVTNPVAIVIHKVAVDTAAEFKDLKPPRSIPLTLAEIAVYAGVILALAAIIYFGYRAWKRRRRKGPARAYVPPPRPAHVIALEQLAALKGKKLWQQGHLKEYYSEATEIVRRYFENRYGVMALEQTTDEIMDELKKHRHAERVWGETEKVLRRADLVKFAKYQPGIDEHEETIVVAFDIVERTKAVETPAVARQPERAHVGA